MSSPVSSPQTKSASSTRFSRFTPKLSQITMKSNTLDSVISSLLPIHERKRSSTAAPMVIIFFNLGD